MKLSEYKLQNTKGIAGISWQLCEEAVGMGFLVQIKSPKIQIDSDSLVHLYLHPSAEPQIDCLLDRIKSPLIVSSAYRTLAQQYILKRNLLTMVAPVGRSDHGSGKSLDIVNYDAHKSSLVACGWIQSYGSRDAVHWDAKAPDNRRNTILAYQRLWNKNYPNQEIEEDGSVGSQVLWALSHTPCNGFPIARIPRYLSRQDMGKDVAEIQSKLRELGVYDGAVDGDFGTGTESAVKAFQTASNILADGVVGRMTRRLLMG